MYRSIESDLLAWKTEPGRKPLLLRGARQVGKSYVVEKFGREHFESLIIINFEFERKFIDCFDNLDPQKIISSISLLAGKSITPGTTLLFFDEIQECPQAILALRYFKEKMPALHVIAAGSLLEFTLNQAEFRMPVGRIQSLYIKPMSFYEFLLACDQINLLDYLSSVQLKAGIEKPIHDLLLEKLREYWVLGGMPEVLQYYIEHKNLLQCQVIQASLMEYYQKDFGKYHQKVKIAYLQALFDKVPGMVAENFKYKNVDPNALSRDIKPAVQALIDAGLIYQVFHTAASGLPMQATINERKFKLLFIDIGLVSHTAQLDMRAMLSQELILLNRGALAEQFVGQELLAYSKPYEAGHLFYWERDKLGSSAEVDYVINVESSLYPLEVKAGKTGRLKSLHIFVGEKSSKFGIRISQDPLSFDNGILTIPLYMIHELERLVKSV